eukprot:Skav209199  [mRNA]  locus=scaffold2666:9976:17946:- [translate_table: standard]
MDRHAMAAFRSEVRTSYWVQSQSTSEEGLRAAENQPLDSPAAEGRSAGRAAPHDDGGTQLLLRVRAPSGPGAGSEERFHAYSAYMTLVQLCVGVSETLSLEVDEKGRPAAPSGWGATYEVKIPKEHMEVIYKYLNQLFVKVTEADVEGIAFNSEGHRVEPTSIYPAPSQNMMTSVRHLTLRTMQTPGTGPEAPAPGWRMLQAGLQGLEMAETCNKKWLHLRVTAGKPTTFRMVEKLK